MPAEENLADLAREGYLPLDIHVRDGVVTLAKLTHVDFQEVWYGETAARVSAESRREVPVDAFVEQYAERQDEGHLRLIAHTSRCGSTLLSNLLSLRPTTMVLNEPEFVTTAAQRTVLATRAGESQTFRALTKALLNFSRDAAAASGREVVIKLTSWSVPVVMASLRERKNTTWLFLWREPVKVVASNMAAPPSWGKDGEGGRAARDLTDVADMVPGTVEFYANIWYRIVDSFMSVGDGLRWRTLKYQDLASEKAASLLAVEAWFDLAFAAGLPDEFERECKRYSKGPRAEIFEPTKAHRRTSLDSYAERTVSAITERALKALREETEHRLLS